MSQVIHFISDLHLETPQSHLMALFRYYMMEIAPKASQLYVLGDLFEVWIGDDDDSELARQVTELFREYSRNSGELFFLHGNRDFLLGAEFIAACNANLLDDPANISWQNHNISIMHGDSLCTDDTDYQNFRKMVRSADWQQKFLSMTLAQRKEYAASVRAQSKAAQADKQTEIMDVNQKAVEEAFIQLNCDWLIHGHTHRPDEHTLKLNLEEPDNIETVRSRTVKRIVLSDWREKGHYLELKNDKATSHFFSITD
ncbi:UDP-2,3-diacylglucosamine diphosphatase [Aliikangiella sp. G2MR2-5]|uniref:UDP-2,3-diacylglucosamine diphosphatase n=1 Tax=Aliikangiella sp. G2MR2-5 TaxID=2788943 RepID=UPI0018A95073|nr:UDP-2,3-diacylglucosamine diphosphatase [Aliikangiella sp. G2MR2-5]